MNRSNEPRRGHGNKNQGDKPSRANFERRDGGKDWGRSSFQKKSGHSDDERRPRRDDGERRPYGERRDNRYSNDRRPRRDDGERRPYGERRSYGDRRDNRRPFNDRRDDRRDDRRPRRDDGERRPYGERRDNRRPFNDRRDDRRDNRRDGYQRDNRRDDRRDGYQRDNRRDDRRDGYQRDNRRDDRRDDRSSYDGQRREHDRPRRTHRRGGLRHVTAEERALSGDEVRLNRFIAHAGVCSRREADKLIADGMVTVNGEVVTEMGHKVKLTDDVRYAGEKLRSEQPVYLLLNKPKGFITTVEDERARKTVMDLVGGACKERIYPVGRLDRATTGVLLFTNDGDMAKKLTHPSHGARKIYHVTVDKPLKATDLAELAKGITLEDGDVKVDKIEMLDEDNPTLVGVELHIGRNRIVRRMFEHLGYEVTKLDRTSFAELTKKNLNRGQYRFLNEKEVGFLKMV